MRNLGLVDRRAFGSILLERIDDLKVPPTLREAAERFRVAHRDYKSGCDAYDAAEAARDAAHAKIVACDAALDEAVLALADALVGARLGTRQKPFARFSPLAPYAITRRPFAIELREVRALISNVERADPPEVVGAAVARCAKRAEAVANALGELTVPQADLTKARAVRDESIERWNKAYERVRKVAQAVWIDEPSTFRATFAPPTSLQIPGPRRRKASARGPKAPAPTPPAARAPAPSDDEKN